jgi:hypothetical protein
MISNQKLNNSQFNMNDLNFPSDFNGDISSIIIDP